MRDVTLFIAMSLDGYIAALNGDVDWLKGEGKTGDDPDYYSNFIQGVDTVLMGWNTYEQIITELSVGLWPYEGLKTFVFTHRKEKSGENIFLTDESPVKVIERIRQEKGKGIWICGGAELVGQLVSQDLIDFYCISIVPVILGQGIRLFKADTGKIDLSLLQTRSYDGIVELLYRRRD